MPTLREQDETTAKKKGLLAGATVAAGAAAAIAVSPVLGVVALIPAAYLTYDWFTFRAKRGMRF